VALSGDTALVGATGDDVGTNADQGSAYVFVRNGTAWSLQQKLTAADGAAGDEFGVSVALSGDTALVGADWDDVGANANQGSVYVFVRSGTTWTQQAILTATDGTADDQFGTSVALSGDTALVGTVWDDVGDNEDQGSVYVFVRSGTTWTQQAQLTAADGTAQDALGRSAALSADGNTALVGVGLNDVFMGAGEAYIFTRGGTGWTQQAKLTAADSDLYDGFGWSVALSGDGDTALLGAWGENVDVNTDQGSAYVFPRSGTTWTQQTKLTASDGGTGETYDYFGGSVALSDDTALVGMYWDAYNAMYKQGSAYVFTRSGTTWSEQGKLTGSDNKWGNYFGISVALWGDTALVGAPERLAIGIDPGRDRPISTTSRSRIRSICLILRNAP
jgi:hypothetical protein